jgi:sugar/nucleoside kinase (ribokinase family)
MGETSANQQNAKAVVAGHVCVDLIPTLHHAATLAPGALLEAGPLQWSAGGAVANTGLALDRLGINTRLIGAIGADRLGPILQQLLSGSNAEPALIPLEDGTTSYSVVISPPGGDRSFLHCPGVNNELAPASITNAMLQDASLLHFGYPPIMRQTYQDGGEQLVDLFARAKTRGLCTSLDTCGFDSNSPAADVNWPAWLQNVLPQVDCFLPSHDELALMLGQTPTDLPTFDQVKRLADQCLHLGCAMVVVKTGADGLLVAVGDDTQRLQALNPHWAQYARQTWIEPCFETAPIGTTGAGDTTIAGFLAGLLQQQSLPHALRTATAVGACCVQQHDAISGIPSLAKLNEKLKTDWPKARSRLESQETT